MEKNQPRVGRQIKNIDQLQKALECDDSIVVHVVDFAEIEIEEQIRLVRSSNILVGMHGAGNIFFIFCYSLVKIKVKFIIFYLILGLTHLMFLPEESVVIELFPMNWSADSMRSLARMARKTYLSWQNTHKENHFPDGGIEPGQSDKQATTIVDVDEFVTVMNIAINMARNFGTSFSQNGLKKCPTITNNQ